MNQESRNASKNVKSPFALSRLEKSPRFARFWAIYCALMVPGAVLLHYSSYALPWAAVIIAIPLFAGFSLWQWERAAGLDREAR